MTKFFEKNSFRISVLILVVLSLASLFFCYVNGYILLYGDAYAHMNIAKRVVDSMTPGLAQLGGSWLPLIHIASIPFIYSDFLWHSGVAGVFQNLFFYVLCGVFIFKTIELLTQNRGVAFFGTLIYSINPNILYLQSTPMTDLSIVFLSTASIYFLVRWVRGNQIIHLIYSAIFAMIASLARYEAWPLIIGEILFILFFLLYKKYGRKLIEGNVIIFASIALLGIAMWLMWEMAIFKDPLYFLNSVYSSKYQQNHLFDLGMLPTRGNLALSLLTYAACVYANIGLIAPLSILFLLILTVRCIIKKENDGFSILAVALFLVMFIFEVYALYKGNISIYLPYIRPYHLYNVRYGVYMLPFVAIITSLFISKFNGHKLKIIFFVLILNSFFLFQKTPISFADGLSGFSHWGQDAYVLDAAIFLHQNYSGGLVLAATGASNLDPLILKSGIPMKNFISEGQKPYWDESLRKPSKYATYIMMTKGDEVYDNLSNADEVIAKYDLIYGFRGDEFQIYKLKK